MRNVENQHWIFKAISIIVSMVIASAIASSVLLFFVNKAQAYESESFCAGSDFNAAGFESIKNARENGYCAEFLKELKAKGDDKHFNAEALRMTKENLESQIIEESAAPRAKELK